MAKILFELPDELESNLRKRVFEIYGTQRGGLTLSITQAIAEWLGKESSTGKTSTAASPPTEPRSPHENRYFEASAEGPEMVLNAVSAISSLVDEATFEVNRDGIFFRGMDPSHIAFIDIFLSKNDFGFYNVSLEQGIKFGIRVDEVKKILKKTHASPLDIYISTTSNLLTFEFDNMKIQSRLIESSQSSTHLPKLSFDTSMRLSRRVINQILSIEELGYEFLRLISGPESLTLESNNGLANLEARIPNDDGRLSVLEFKQESKAVYSLDYITKLLKSQISLDFIKGEFSSNMPLRLTVHLGKTGNSWIHFYLAPQVRD